MSRRVRQKVFTKNCKIVSTGCLMIASEYVVTELQKTKRHSNYPLVHSKNSFAKCLEMSTQKHVAIKIVKKDFEDAGEDEIKALIELSKIDADKYNLVKFVEWFHHNNHVCIVFDMLDQSLYDYLEKRGFRPLSLRTIRCLAWQLLVALSGLKKINMVHFDIKPDNIMLVDQNAEPLRLKLIDFGLAEKVEDLEMGIRIQNICFRAPEVMLGLPLDERLDMWTVGYVLGMLYAGFYFYPQDSEYNIIRALVKMYGMPDNELLEEGMYTDRFFTRTEENSTFNWKLDTPEQQFEKTGQKAQKVEEFMDLLKRMLEVDPNKRISPDEALQHPLFKLGKKRPQTPKEPAQVHQEPEATHLCCWKHLPCWTNASSNTAPGGRVRLRVIQTKNVLLNTPIQQG
uniref:Protein kinase domain-containing protein n=1 Tax=Oryzias melastigma TaxID=30732 RepID=A0A3B3BBP1_ORYME